MCPLTRALASFSFKRTLQLLLLMQCSYSERMRGGDVPFSQRMVRALKQKHTFVRCFYPRSARAPLRFASGGWYCGRGGGRKVVRGGGRGMQIEAGGDVCGVTMEEGCELHTRQSLSLCLLGRIHHE